MTDTEMPDDGTITQLMGGCGFRDAMPLDGYHRALARFEEAVRWAPLTEEF